MSDEHLQRLVRDARRHSQSLEIAMQVCADLSHEELFHLIVGEFKRRQFQHLGLGRKEIIIHGLQMDPDFKVSDEALLNRHVLSSALRNQHKLLNLSRAQDDASGLYWCNPGKHYLDRWPCDKHVLFR